MSKNPKNFLTGQFIKRYKRFFVDVQLDSKKIVTAHCPNTGSMMGLLEKDNLVYLTQADDPNRKLKFTLEAIQSNGAMVGVNTHRANRIVEEAISNGKISELGNIVSFKREVKYGQNSRIDFLVQTGLKHLNELSTLPTKSVRAVMLFLVQRDDCSKFKIAADIDTKYADTFKKVKKMGVEPLCYDCSFGRNGISVNKKIKILN